MKLMTIAATFLVAFPTLFSAQDVSLSKERRELAEIRVLLGADRDYAAAKERLATLATALEASSDAEAATLAAEVERLRAEVRRALGEAVPASSANASQDRVDYAVQVAIESSDFAFLNQLGARAAPGLVAAIEAEPDHFVGNVNAELLILLLRLDPGAADALLSRMLDHDGFFWRTRVMRALKQADPWGQSNVLWSTDTPPRFLGEGMLRTLEKYAEDRDVGNDALHMLQDLTSRGARSERYFEVLGVALRSSDTPRREAAKHAVKSQTPFKSVEAMLDALLAEPDADLRAFAAGVLSRRGSRALFAHVDDPDARVRAGVAERLKYSDAYEWREEELSALTRLLVDEDSDVRTLARSVLADIPKKRHVTNVAPALSANDKPGEYERILFDVLLPADAYRALLESPASEERKFVGSLAQGLPAPLCFDVLRTLASDRDPEVAAVAVFNLHGLPFWEDPDAVLRVASAWLDNAVTAGDEGSRDRLRNALPGIGQTRTGIVALARWALVRQEPDLIQSTRIDWKQLARIDATLLGPFAERWFRIDPRKVRYGLMGMEHQMLRMLVADTSLPIVLRLLSASVGAEGEQTLGAGWGEPLVALVGEPAWSEVGREEWEWLGQELERVVGELGDEESNRVIAGILANPGFPEWLSVHALSRFEGRAPGATEISRIVLERWFQEPGPHVDAVRRALGTMAYQPDLRDDALLAEATQREFASSAWFTIRTLRDPAFLPLIREAIEARADANAIGALFGYMSDEAAELLLLAAARTTDADLRDSCLAHLEKIREYQDSRERWATRKVKGATREQVLAQLVAQLDQGADDVKVQAIRALATWEAVEAMPRLIELTTSGSKSVAAAAREALDRLNAAKDE